MVLILVLVTGTISNNGYRIKTKVTRTKSKCHVSTFKNHKYNQNKFFCKD